MNLPNSLTPISFVPGQVYRRRDLHAQFRGQQQGGICTPAAFPIIIIFTGDTGEAFGYHDGWDGDVFKYIGEGQIGDMSFVRGNRAIRDHVKDGKDLHLFRCVRPGLVQYVGQMVCIAYSWTQTMDFEKKMRQAISFHLQFIDQRPLLLDEAKPAQQTLQMPLDVLRANALQTAVAEANKRTIVVDVRFRTEAIRLYALKRADGRCESCRADAPFKTRSGEPFLECHHLKRLSDGGPDHPGWVAGLCPNCHRHIHYGTDGASLNDHLITTIQQKEVRLFGKF